MVTLRHRFRKSGGIKVRDTWYELDKAGRVHVSQDHAKLLLQGAMWIEVETVAEPPVPPLPAPLPPFSAAPQDTPADGVGTALAEMDRSELLELARSKGVDVDGRWGRLKLVSKIREAQKKED